jgi:hypothetical protein
MAMPLCFGLAVNLHGAAPVFRPEAMARAIYAIWLAHISASRSGNRIQKAGSMTYWGLSSAVLAKPARKPPRHTKGVRTTLQAALSAPTGVTGGQAPYPRTWIPKLMSALGFTLWKKKSPTLEQVKTLLKLHRMQLLSDTPEFREALRWEFFISSYQEQFFKHMIDSVILQLKLAE